MTVVGRVGQQKGLTVEPDQAVVAEPPYGVLNEFLVADLTAHFGHRPVMRVAGQRKCQHRPLGAFRGPSACAEYASPASELRFRCRAGGPFARLPRPFDLLTLAKLEQGGAAI